MPYEATHAVTIEEIAYQEGQSLRDHHGAGAIESALRMGHIRERAEQPPEIVERPEPKQPEPLDEPKTQQKSKKTK